jgi:hypothetical protein
MSSQKTLPKSLKPKSDRKRIAFYIRVMTFVVMLLSAVVIGILAITPGGAIYTGLIALIALVFGGIAIYPIIVPPKPTSETVPTSTNNVQSANGAQVVATYMGQLIFFPNLELPDLKEFYGHNVARRTLIARTSNGGSSSIVGEHKWGTTWLLKYLKLVMPTHSKPGRIYRIGYISVPPSSLGDFIQQALRQLDVSRSSYDLGLPPLKQLSQGLSALQMRGFVPVLCIDEFEGFNKNRREFNAEFFDGLRTMTQNDGLVLITASKRPLKELMGDMRGQTSPLYNTLQQISLFPFTEQEANDFVSNKSIKAGFTQRENDFFLSRSTLYNTNGREPSWPPLLLQLVGQMLFDDKQHILGQSLDDKLDDPSYQNDFETRLSKIYWPI